MKNEYTGKVVGKIAALGIKYPEKLTRAQIVTVCASVLTQRPNRKKP